MAQSGFTPIQLYRSATPGAVPTAGNLAPGELALNTADEKLFFENASGVVVSIDKANGTVTSVNASGGTTGLTFSGGPITTSGTLTLAGTLAVANGGTGVTTSTGTGSVVLSNSPVLVTPTLGVASATSIATGLGAVGTPSHTFTGDLNTGMWSPGTDTVAFSTNGAERMRLDSGGNVLVGTTSSASLTSFSGAAVGQAIQSALPLLALVDDGDTTNFVTWLGNNSGTGFLLTKGAHPLNLGANNTVNLSITSAGNVGIGTTSPGAKLDVSSSASNIVIARSTGGFAAFQRIAPSGQNAYDFYTINGVEAARITVDASISMAFATGSAATERMRIDSSGNVGIGTSTPSYLLQGVQNGNAEFRVSSTNAGTNSAGLTVENQGNRNWNLWANRATDKFIIGANSRANDFLSVDGVTGNVGIGTTSPAQKLHVNGNALLGGSPAAQYSNVTISGDAAIQSAAPLLNFVNAAGSTRFGYLYHTGSGGNIELLNQQAGALLLGTNNAERMRIDSSGNVGIGTTSPTGKLGVAVTGSRTLGSAWDAASVLVGSPGQFSGNLGFSFDTTNGATLESAAPGVATYPIRLAGSQAQFFTANTERMRIDSSGNVGIGTSSPGAKFDVSSSSFNIVASRSTTSFAAFQRFAPSGQTAYDFYTINGVEAARIAVDGSNIMSFATGSAATERMRIDSSGNVGIGEGAPGAKLDVYAGSVGTTAGNLLNITNDGGLAGGNAVRIRTQLVRVSNGTDWTTTAMRLQGRVDTTDFGYIDLVTGGAQGMAFGAGGAERMRIDSAGNVGIGTSSVNARLSLGGLVSNKVFALYDDGTNQYGMGIAGSQYRMFAATGANLCFGNYARSTDTFTETVRIDSSGNVGMGTSSPGFKLQVGAASGANQVAYFVNTSAGSTLAGIVASIESGGNNTNSYHFAGVTQTVALWYLYGNGTTSYTSDIRVKKNVTTTRDGYLEDVCKLRVVKYNWYNDSDDTPRELGFIAQEVEQVFPGLVQDALHPTKDGEIHKVLKGSVMMPIMLKALQEASAKIDALTARVAQLEGN